MWGRTPEQAVGSDRAESLRARLESARQAFAETLAEPNLRRAQLAFGAALAAKWAFTVALSVVAYREGGATAVGLVGALCVAPSLVLVPFSAALADRFARERVLIVAGASCAVWGAGAAAAVAADAPLAWICVLAIATTASLDAVRPAHSALLPALCRTPRQLTSATLVRGMMDSLATLVGPAVAAAGLAVASPQAVFVAVAVAAATSALLIARVRYEAPPREQIVRRRIDREAVEGFTALARHRDVAVLFGIALAQAFTRGALVVLTVVIAIDVLQSGEPYVGVLTAAIGAGAVAGSLGATLLAGSHALARWEGVGVALWGFALWGCAAFEQHALVLAFFVAIGVGNALIEAPVWSLPAQIVPEEVVGRVFGSFEALIALSVTLGSLAAPLAIDAFGIRGALVAIGIVCPLCVIAVWSRLRRIDATIARRDADIELLRNVAMLEPLGLPAIERIAARLQAQVVRAGGEVFRQRDTGEHFYVIESGSAEIRRDGKPVRSLDPGEAFGEIALLRSCTRTATVRALTELHVRAIHRDDFLLAINGYRSATAAAEQTVLTLLQADSERATDRSAARP